MSIDYSYDRSIESAYVITVEGNTTSETLSARAVESCTSVGMPVKRWNAVSVDKVGDRHQMKFPVQITEDNICRYIKRTNTDLTATEIACALSHISLWVHCIKLDRPIVILEHDAVMQRKIAIHQFYNAIHYLGCRIYKSDGNAIKPIPIMGHYSANHKFMYCAHAYAIDPCIAKNLLSYVLQNGLLFSLDVLLRTDLFSVQYDQTVYAYELPGETTILNRNEDNPIPNENLTL
jgi:GR25 family glycosyltransferase involved in LPS biosynthesis